MSSSSELTLPIISEASAPGKLILCGEHAVVYGTTAVAGALSDLRVFSKAVRKTYTCVMKMKIVLYLQYRPFFAIQILFLFVIGTHPIVSLISCFLLFPRTYVSLPFISRKLMPVVN